MKNEVFGNSNGTMLRYLSNQDYISVYLRCVMLYLLLAFCGSWYGCSVPLILPEMRR